MLPVCHCGLHVLWGVAAREHIPYMSTRVPVPPEGNGIHAELECALVVSWPCCLDILGICAILLALPVVDPVVHLPLQGMHIGEGDALILQFLLQFVLRIATPISVLWIARGHAPTPLRARVDDYTEGYRMVPATLQRLRSKSSAS